MSSLLEKALKKIEDLNNIQEEEEIQKDDKPIKIEDLKPPKASKPVIKNTAKISKIDFNKIANRSYFQRFIEDLFKDIMPNQFKGVDFRVSREVAAKLFDDKITEIERGSKEHLKM